MKETPILFSGPGWRNIAGYENEYAISHDGKVFSYRSNREIAIAVNNCGYPTVLLRVRGQTKRHLVHRLVAAAFVLNPDSKPVVNHLDGNKQNNHCSNLEWSTPSENEKHAYATGLKRGIKGQHLSVETKAKLSAALKGRKSPCGFAGKTRSPESIAKFQASMRARREARKPQ